MKPIRTWVAILGMSAIAALVVCALVAHIRSSRTSPGDALASMARKNHGITAGSCIIVQTGFVGVYRTRPLILALPGREMQIPENTQLLRLQTLKAKKCTVTGLRSGTISKFNLTEGNYTGISRSAELIIQTADGWAVIPRDMDRITFELAAEDEILTVSFEAPNFTIAWFNESQSGSLIKRNLNSELKSEDLDQIPKIRREDFIFEATKLLSLTDQGLFELAANTDYSSLSKLPDRAAIRTFLLAMSFVPNDSRISVWSRSAGKTYLLRTTFKGLQTAFEFDQAGQETGFFQCQFEDADSFAKGAQYVQDIQADPSNESSGRPRP